MNVFQLQSMNLKILRWTFYYLSGCFTSATYLIIQGPRVMPKFITTVNKYEVN